MAIICKLLGFYEIFLIKVKIFLRKVKKIFISFLVTKNKSVYTCTNLARFF